MNSIIEFLKGKKVYLLAIIVVLIVVCEKLLGIDVPGVEVGDNWMDFILAALGLTTVRAAIAKTGNGQ